MPAVLICTKPDGRILVSAMPEAPAEYEQDAVEVASIEEAAAMVTEVLGDEGGEAPMTGEQEQAEEQAEMPGAEGMPTGTPDEAMQAGFTRAKKGY